uniref:Uncharacterized protein n=1 Tax=Poecilia mexicana TaxID=48701 RepID=A0A3B3X2S8_9TELE
MTARIQIYEPTIYNAQTPTITFKPNCNQQKRIHLHKMFALRQHLSLSVRICWRITADCRIRSLAVCQASNTLGETLVKLLTVCFLFLQTCSLECEGVMDTQRLRMCQDFLTESDDNVSEAVRLPKHQIDKKYGGFMKRYGGFMSRRSSSVQRALNNLENNNDEEDTRLGILKIIGATKDHDIEESRDEMEAVKRYAGSLFEAVLGHALKKRYGGFMRRVGRPEWLVDNSKNGEAPKTSGEKESGRKKRYGGFMD